MTTDEAMDHLSDAVAIACTSILNDPDWVGAEQTADEMMEAYYLIQQLKGTKRMVVRRWFYRVFNRI